MPKMMKKMFRDDTSKNRQIKEDGDSKKTNRNEDKLNEVLKQEPSRFKLNKMNDLFKDTSKDKNKSRTTVILGIDAHKFKQCFYFSYSRKTSQIGETRKKIIPTTTTTTNNIFRKW